MARQTNDGEPTYGKGMGEKAKETEIRPPYHLPGAAAGPLSPQGDEPPLVRVHLSEDGSHIIEETLSPSGGVVSARVRPR